MAEELLYIDSSTLSTLVCSTRAFVRHCLHLTSSHEVAVLESGAAGHEALAVYFRTGDRKKALAALKPYKAWCVKNESEGVVIEPRLSYRNLRRVVQAWIDAHPIDGLPFTLPLGKKGVEVGFQADIGDSVILTGRMDLIVQDRDGIVAPLDNKFTGRISSPWVKKFRLTAQLSNYCIALEHHIGSAVLRAYVNAIELPVLPDSNRTCSKHKLAYRECGLLHATSRIFIVTRTPRMLERARLDALTLAKRFRALREHASVHGDNGVRSLPMEGAHFDSCYWCEFQEFCAHGRPLQHLRELFVEDVWNPLAYAKGEKRR